MELLTVIIFLISFAVGSLFIRNFIAGLLLALIVTSLYLGVITIGFDLGLLIPW